MHLVIFGVNVLILVAVWRFMIRKTVLDNSRDRLFDLRDEVRSTFLKNGWGLDSSVYKKLRDLLNGHLRFTEDYSVFEIAYMEVSIRAEKNLQQELHDKFERVFSTGDAKQVAYIQSIRSRSLEAIMDFAVFSSGFLVFASLMVTPFYLFFKMFSVVGRGMDAAAQVCYSSAANVEKFCSNIVLSSARLIAKHIFAPDLFENVSYRKGTS